MSGTYITNNYSSSFDKLVTQGGLSIAPACLVYVFIFCLPYQPVMRGSIYPNRMMVFSRGTKSGRPILIKIEGLDKIALRVKK